MTTMKKRHILLVIRCLFISLNLLVSCLSENKVEDITSNNESKDNEKIITRTKELAEDEYDLGYGLRLVVDAEPIESVQSNYQNITLYKSNGIFGKILVIDDCIQLTEWDAPNYNEMLAHIGMMSYYPTITTTTQDKEEELELGANNVAVIGGGDGYIVNEIIKHPSIKQLDHIELDPYVIQFSKKHFLNDAWYKDARVTVHIHDGATFIERKSKHKPKFYDVIIQDTSDPFVVEEDGSITTLPSNVLYTYEHFVNVYNSLSDDGVFVFQAETYNVPSSLNFIRTWRNDALKAGFISARYGTIGKVIHICILVINYHLYTT